MKLSRFDHRTEAILLNPEVSTALSHLTTILESTPVPYWLGKSQKQATKSVLQPVLNTFIEQELLAAGWEREVRVTGGSDGMHGMCVDFARQIGNRLMVVEVQFGNVGRTYSDFHKFEHLQMEGRLPVAILVTLRHDTAVLTDSGIATFETSVRRIEEVKNTIFKAIPVPLVCLGLSHQDAPLVDFSRSRFADAKVLSGTGAKADIAHAVSALRSGTPIEDVGPRVVIDTARKPTSQQGQLSLLL